MGSIFSLASLPITSWCLTLSGISASHRPGVLPSSSHRSPSWVWFPDVHLPPKCACVVLCVMSSQMHNPDLLIPHLHTHCDYVTVSRKSVLLSDSSIIRRDYNFHSLNERGWLVTRVKVWCLPLKREYWELYKDGLWGRNDRQLVQLLFGRKHDKWLYLFWLHFI